jgi:hypothetical protein
MAPTILMPLGTKSLAHGKTLIGSLVRLNRPRPGPSNGSSLSAEPPKKTLRDAMGNGLTHALMQGEDLNSMMQPEERQGSTNTEKP